VQKRDQSTIFSEIFKVSALRNEAAHGGETLCIERAKKAQDVTYVHIPSPDPSINTDSLSLLVTCKNLITEILNLF